MEIGVYHSKSGKQILKLKELDKSMTILDIKNAVYNEKKHLYPDRVEVRLEPKSKGLKDSETLDHLKLHSGDKVYLKDLGPQIGWKTVFVLEYAGPFVLYSWIYQRPWLFYGASAAHLPYSDCTNIALACWMFHYLKRILETLFIHRFSHGTMPIFNLFKNCSYYWGFAAYVAYHINHPYFTPPSKLQMYAALAAFIVCELGNLSIHVALRNLRPPGTKDRKIPYPTSNPLTLLFRVVSCPNYTYEVGAWVSFTIMTQCLPAGLFAFAGFYQMLVWAKGKHRNYKKEFSNYPADRKAIIPFLL